MLTGISLPLTGLREQPIYCTAFTTHYTQHIRKMLVLTTVSTASVGHLQL